MAHRLAVSMSSLTLERLENGQHRVVNAVERIETKVDGMLAALAHQDLRERGLDLKGPT
jgi:hypothetical protein